MNLSATPPPHTDEESAVRAVVAALQRAQRAEVPEGRPTYVMALEGAGWQLVAGQNTQVVTT